MTHNPIITKLVNSVWFIRRVVAWLSPFDYSGKIPDLSGNVHDSNCVVYLLSLHF